MLALGLAGDDALDARLGALPAAVLADLAIKAAAIAETLADRVRGDKLSGQALNAVSGDLRASIVGGASLAGDAVVGSVGSTGGVKYAAIQEYGGKTAAHEILPSKARVLAFMIGGALRFARRVEHPGSTIPERSYLRSALDEMTDEIIETLGQSPTDAWESL